MGEGGDKNLKTVIICNNTFLLVNFKSLLSLDSISNSKYLFNPAELIVNFAAIFMAFVGVVLEYLFV